ncbi:Microtubule-associated protein TORTIFOLIA1 [Ananas comosus]|nr:Microtubule-associated protein TORTIFOLIA1 [Ananas comosus]
MAELKSRAQAAVAKLSDRDTHHIAIDDLEKLIGTLAPEGVATLVAALAHDPSAPPPSAAARRESLRLLAALCAAHPGAAAKHIPRIVAHLVKRVRDPASDSSVRDAARDAAGCLSALYLRPDASDGESSSPEAAAAVFVRPLLEAMGDQSKAVQAGAAACLAKVVECAGPSRDGSTTAAFRKLCPRICKLLSAENFLAKGALLSVVSSLAQVGAISPQNMQQMLHSIHECLESSDWATRKAAADTLCMLSAHSSHLIGDGAAPTIAALEACRFDKVKPVRDSMIEALQLLKNIKGEDANSEDPLGGKNCQSVVTEAKLDFKDLNISSEGSELSKDPSPNSSPQGQGSCIREKGAMLLKKKAPSLRFKGLNPEFFRRLEERAKDELSVDVVLPCKKPVDCPQSQDEEEPEMEDGDSNDPVKNDGFVDLKLNHTHGHINDNSQRTERRIGSYNKLHNAKCRGSEGNIDEASFVSNGANWSTIQRQLSQLERQQANLMNMLQDFTGGSHDRMVNLENRVQGLERVVEEMARDFSIPYSARSSSNYSSFHEFPTSKYMFSRGRDLFWKSESEARDSHSHLYTMRNGVMNSWRAWGKGEGSLKLGEGPSARSIWRASKDEATLEAIRVAGEDNITSRATARAIDSVQVGDLDSAYGEVLSSGDALLLVKLMDDTGPVFNWLSSDVANYVLNAIGEFLLEQRFFHIALPWLQQLTDLVVENGADFLGIPPEGKREILLNLHETSVIGHPEDFEGPTPHQIMMQLASTWKINLQQLIK